jgi:hypothetical protein
MSEAIAEATASDPPEPRDAPMTAEERVIDFPDPQAAVLLPGEAAAVLRVPVETLRSWRHRRRRDGTRAGPAFIRIEGNRVRYLRKDVDAYLEAQRYAKRGGRRV